MRTFIGVTPRSLASGRPLVFGDVVDAKDLTPEDEPLADLLVDTPDPPASKATEPSTSTPEDK